MSTLLKIRASIFGAASQSSKLADRFAQKWQRANPGGRVITRDLAPDTFPHLTGSRYQAFNTPADRRTPEQKRETAFSDVLVRELEVADVIALAAPMYNFSVPSALRDYFDHVARAGVTFRFTSEGPQGLLTGKKVYAFITRGGQYAADTDTQTPYLKQFLAFIGLGDIEFIYAEGMAMGDEVRKVSLQTANTRIAGLSAIANAA